MGSAAPARKTERRSALPRNHPTTLYPKPPLNLTNKTADSSDTTGAIAG